MKSAATGTASGCVVWTVGFCMLSFCVLTVALPLSGLMTTLNEDFMTSTMGPYLCPPDSTGEIVTHASTGTDSNGNIIETTAYEMQCVDANGVVVRERSSDYAFIFIGVVGLVGLVLAAVLAFVFAAPVGVLVANLTSRWRSRAR
jgi:hypothetical protein